MKLINTAATVIQETTIWAADWISSGGINGYIAGFLGQLPRFLALVSGTAILKSIS